MVIPLTDAGINRALDYYFRKATLEVKNFVKKNVYQKISTEKDGILFYKGRILPSQAIGGRKRLSDIMTDLSDRTFAFRLLTFIPLLLIAKSMRFIGLNLVRPIQELRLF